ncbi:hypothetical protein ABT063_38340 [Streptomyces sp. NPDC002838]|uniref:hypothetical protein n=1 Tax=Streptomyces sp. NPDC002838 TaxID=3154436 RepID=UPI0033286009
MRLAVVPTRQATYGDVPAFVERIRDTPAPAAVLVGGYPGETTDFRATHLDRLPLAVGFVLVSTYVILFSSRTATCPDPSASPPPARSSRASPC